MQTIKIPVNPTSLDVIKFNGELLNYSGIGKYNFDFSSLKFVKPFAMLFLAHSIRNFKEAHKDTADFSAQIDVDKSSACNYLAHVGFFFDVGFEHGNPTGRAPRGYRYIPITEIVFSDLSKESKYEDLHDLMDEKSKELASVLVQSSEGEAHEILSYCIRESLRNAMEHSKADSVRICAQYWPKINKAQIAIMDEGIGVLNSLTSNSLYREIDNDTSALERAIEPAVSSSPLIPNRNKSVWDNSGFGLYMLKRICKDSGSFLISSNTAALKIDNKQSAWGHDGMNGTSLKVEIDLKKLSGLGTLEENLKRYRDESKVATEPSSSSMAFFS